VKYWNSFGMAHFGVGGRTARPNFGAPGQWKKSKVPKQSLAWQKSSKRTI
jgi:hypothetical protein